MKEINMEHLEYYVMQQPPSREVNLYQAYYKEQPGCLLCNFLRDFCGKVNYDIGWFTLNVDKKPVDFPEKLARMILGINPKETTFGHIQKVWRETFPDTHLEPTPSPEAVKEVSEGRAV